MNVLRGVVLCTVVGLAGAVAQAADQAVGITQTLGAVDVIHNGKKVRIERNPDNFNLLDPDYAMTSRPCPPFCIQPMVIAPGVETLGELEMLDYLKRLGTDGNLLVIDSRDGDWPQRSGVIPGAIVLPWQQLHPQFTEPDKIAETLIFRFGATRVGPLWNFENARTLVFYCNGPWCGQSPTIIKQLLSMGYPSHKLKWYRGGMQDWKSLGLTTVAPN